MNSLIIMGILFVFVAIIYIRTESEFYNDLKEFEKKMKSNSK